MLLVLIVATVVGLLEIMLGTDCGPGMMLQAAATTTGFCFLSWKALPLVPQLHDVQTPRLGQGFRQNPSDTSCKISFHYAEKLKLPSFLFSCRRKIAQNFPAIYVFQDQVGAPGSAKTNKTNETTTAPS
jgi:hypothetical protein